MSAGTGTGTLRRDTEPWWRTGRPRRGAPGAGPDRVLTTVLFTDLVGSTQLAAELGDRGWNDLLRRHDEVVRRELRRFGGREVKTLGDGFTASFATPARAIRCGVALADAVSELGLTLRAGLHCGECDSDGDDLHGIAVNIAARVAALAAAGEVVVTRTMRDVVQGAAIEFADRGEHRLRGVPGQWQIFRAVA